MDWEAPADAWYVWLAVSIVSVALAGIALGLPTGPPPDANQAANTIEEVTGSSLEASGSYEHDAETVVVDGTTIEMKNAHGTSHASINYGVVVPVNDSTRLENITRGASFDDEYEDEIAHPEVDAAETFLSELVAEYEENSGERLTASGELAVRKLTLDPGSYGVEPRGEWATLSVTGTSEDDNVQYVTLTYGGLSDRYVELELDGSYTTGTSLEYDDSRVGGGEIEIGQISSPILGWAGDPPLDFEVDFQGGAWAGEVVADESWSGELDTEETLTWENEIDHGATLDDDARYIERDDETDRYHVTLVVV